MYQKDYQTGAYTQSGSKTYSIEQTTSALYRHMFGWMTAGLGLTGLTSYAVVDRLLNSESFASTFLSSGAMFGMGIASFVLVMIISAGINRLSFTTATLLFALYSVLMGAWIAPVFLIYTATSVTQVFFITAGTFAAMALYGHFTKSDLSSVGKIAMMGLIGIIIASLVNIFFKSPMMNYIISYAGVAIFCGLTMWDVQKFKQYILGYGEIADNQVRKIALLGALTLYMDFLNLFLYLLRILGSRRD